MYQGYSNYETWAAILYIGNEQKLYKDLRAYCHAQAYKASPAHIAVRVLLYWPNGHEDLTKTRYLSVNWDEVAEWIQND